eukprot:5414268-Pyramimonas_sp.AAC.1
MMLQSYVDVFDPTLTDDIRDSCWDEFGAAVYTLFPHLIGPRLVRPIGAVRRGRRWVPSHTLVVAYPVQQRRGCAGGAQGRGSAGGPQQGMRRGS